MYWRAIFFLFSSLMVGASGMVVDEKLYPIALSSGTLNANSGLAKYFADLIFPFLKRNILL